MKNLGFIWVLTLIIKLFLAAVIPLSADEAYYWVWSLRPQLSYFDHPPFVAWLFFLGHFLEPLGHAVRWPAVIMAHCTLLVWVYIWSLLKPEFKEQKISWWLGLALCSPLLGFGSLIVTPDLPVVFFWSASLAFVVRVLLHQKPWDYAFLGMSLGLGFSSKYHIVIFVPVLLAYLVFERQWHLINWKKVSLTIIFGLIFSSPVLIWNFQNDFSSFRFQLNHGLNRPDYEFYWTWSYVAAQILILFPTVVWCAIQAKLPQRFRIFYYFAWGPLLFFFLSSFRALVEMNWPIVAYPAFFAVAVLGARNSRPFWIANIFWVSIFLILFSHTLKPWVPFAPEKLSELNQFEELAKNRSKYEPLYASTYQMASWVWYKTKVPFFKLHGMSRLDLFDTYEEGTPQKFPIYVALRRHTPLPDWIQTGPSYKITEVESFDNDFTIVRIDR